MRFVRDAILVIGMSTAAIAVASEPVLPTTRPAISGSRTRNDLLGGVVTNQTVTVAGYDFYRHFVSAWRERDIAERFAISIRERPSARSGTQVWIEYGQRRIFQAALPALRANIKALSENAVEIAYQKVTEAELERLLVRDVDVGQDEI